MRHRRLVPLHCLPAVLALGLLAALPDRAVAAVPVPQATADATRIVAVVNSDVITNADVDNRARLFALSTGLRMAPEILDRLKPQIIRQLIDERLRMQEVQRRKLVVPDKQIAEAIREIESRNGMAPGTLHQKLAAQGVSQLTLIDQIRTQLGWTDVLREKLGDQAQITDAQIAEQQRLAAMQVGQPEFRVGEIFIPVEDPAATADAQRFAESVISNLRGGAPFPLVAAQFSQTQTALAGGELGWVQLNQLDPEVAQLVQQMPVGAVSNPVKVPGGFSIVALQGRREIGHDIGTIVSMRQVVLPFTTPLDPQTPTEQQRQTLEKARGVSSSVHSCEQMEQVAKTVSPGHAPDPGDVRLEAVNPPAFRQMLATLPFNRATQPLVSTGGITVVIVCSREQKNLAAQTAQEVRQRLLNERIELVSRQLLRDLRRKADIEIRAANRA